MACIQQDQDKNFLSILLANYGIAIPMSLLHAMRDNFRMLSNACAITLFALSGLACFGAAL